MVIKIKAISLIELSIVMIITATFIIITLSVFSLLNKANVLEIITSITTLETKTIEFQTIFNRLPGDMEYATNYWELSEFENSCNYRDSSGVQLKINKGFDGNGDGYVDFEKNNIESSDYFTESSAFMCHLRLADMITHNPTVIKLNNKLQYINNLTLPTKNKGVYIIVTKPLTEWKYQYTSYIDKINEIVLVSNNLSSKDKWPSNISRKEAFLLDKKIDDGKPGSGKIKCKGVLFDCCSNSTKEKECTEKSSYIRDNKRNGILIFYSNIIAKY